MDREKVIKEWESVLSRDPLDAPWDLIDETLALLKDQKAVEPKHNSLDCREDCCGNCEHSIKTDIEGWVICQFDNQSRKDGMLCERYEWNLK